MPRDYYNDAVTDTSISVLRTMSTTIDFVLIGGWAVNSYVKMQKSKDIDIVIAPEELGYFKNYGLRKHGIEAFHSVIDNITVDIFVQGISDKELTIPTKRILKSYNSIEGIKVVEKELLLLLKMCGYFSDDAQKIEKDVIDVVALLFYGDINLMKVKKAVDEYNIEARKGPQGFLEYLDRGAALWEYIAGSQREYAALREKAKLKINQVFYAKR